MKRLPMDNKGGAAVEFAILLPVWLMIFFAFLDYGWYLTNVMVLENAVWSGARAGVKVKYWLDPNDEEYLDPKAVARNMVRESFWLNRLKDEDIFVAFKDSNHEVVDEDENFDYLEVKVPEYRYGLLTGYLPDGMIPTKIAALSLTSFP